ncbi:MAG: electron transport complex subunit RsxA [Nitrospirae bacterium GWF2_44_13]|jgi:electron transport complex protein RnfA|nr:MAG: electron transport complex subunit RsxA [Nitrospirae bacterium GWF2_44_13]OGW35079.1 MAG: electron transport complex subunit RsxA [Nitrospirae bacterium GWD2_44_7]OGW65807.1 MAG: electron transport complex subunit RsxA [Nitrospirae bacterium RIFOXYA2_FULL_44_9]HBG92694.1 electron transport complex subunit RsxA [Nitrospiraceae bacterium]
MEFGKLFELFIAAALINNFVFTRYLGLCIFFGVTKKMDTSIGMSITFTSVMVISAALNWIIYKFIMIPLGLGFLEIVIFIGVVAGFVQAADTIMKKVSPGLYYKLGIYLALITTNCIILAVPLLNVSEGYSFMESMFFGFGSGVGFSLAMIIMASIREKLELADVPKAFQGLPISFIITGLIALAFMGFSGLITL